MGMPAARLTDMHTCAICMGAPMPIVTVGAPTVMIGMLPAARMTDMCVCIPPIVPDMIAFGSPTVLIMSLPAARVADPTAKGGVILPPGCINVLIGLVGVPAPPSPPGMPSAPGMPGMPPLPPVAGAAAITGGPLVEVGPGDGVSAVFRDSERVVGPWTSATTAANGRLVSAQVGPNISVFGDPDFVNQTLEDLAKLYATPTGKKLLDSLNSGPHKTKIVKSANGGNGCGYTNPDDRWANPDGRPGAGTGSMIAYNPDSTSNGPEDWAQRPPEVGLAHELVHADDAAKGQMARGSTGGVPNRELQAVGLPPYENKDPSENTLRRDMNMLRRPVYD